MKKKKLIDKLSTWDWETLVAAWRYYEYRTTISGSSFPADIVDMVLCDLPYGTTDNRWDSIIPFGFLSEQYRRVCNREAAILLFAAPPFSYKLGMSELRDLFRFQYVWIKNRPTGAAFSHYQPMRKFEDILVFSKSGCSINLNSKKPQTLMNYFPVMGFGKMEKRRKAKWKSENYHAHRSNYNNEQSYYTCAKWPDNVLVFDCAAGGGHPTEKPVPLLEHLIQQHSKEGDLVLDNTMGSGSAGVAAMRKFRKFIGIEMEEKYFRLAYNRIDTASRQPKEAYLI